MDEMLKTLSGGVLGIAVIFGLLYWRGAESRVAALASVFLVGVVYTAYAVTGWPGMDIYAMHVAIYGILGFFLAIIGLQRGRDKAVRLHWGPLVLVGFFTVVVSMSSVFVYIAGNGMPSQLAGVLLPEPRSGAKVVSTSFPGTVDRRYQEKDDEYSRHLEQVRTQEERGWQVRQGFVDTPVAGEEVAFRVEVLDRDGNPVTGADVTGQFMRPASELEDIGFELKPVDNGLYGGTVELENPGLWELDLQVRRDGELHQVYAETTVESR